MSHLGPQMSADSTKRSIVRSGQKTSVSLESEFWSCFREIAIQQKTNLSALVSRIDKTRNDANLSSAIRVFVLNHLAGANCGRASVRARPPRSSAVANGASRFRLTLSSARVLASQQFAHAGAQHGPIGSAAILLRDVACGSIAAYLVEAESPVCPCAQERPFWARD